MRSTLSLVLTAVIAIALGVFGTVAFAGTLAGTSSSEAAQAEQEARSGSDSDSSNGGNVPLVYGTR
jgi:hypothetical protein